MTKIELIHGDCEEGMKGKPDNFYDLAFCDPPYFSGPEKREYYGNEFSTHGVKRIDYKPLKGTWKIPNIEYYNEVKRISKNQIIWGINYFDFGNIGPGRIIWDKVNESSSFSDCEIAFCSLIKSVRIFRFMWHGMMQGSKSNGSKMEGNKKLNEIRIHQTQKPVQLYKWSLKKFAKPGFKIIDTHGGSFSSVIACIEMGFDITIYEDDKDCFDAAVKRVKNHVAQLNAFIEVPEITII